MVTGKALEYAAGKSTHIGDGIYKCPISKALIDTENIAIKANFGTGTVPNKEDYELYCCADLTRIRHKAKSDYYKMLYGKPFSLAKETPDDREKAMKNLRGEWGWERLYMNPHHYRDNPLTKTDNKITSYPEEKGMQHQHIKRTTELLGNWKLKDEDPQVNYTFDTSSSEAINFEEISKELSSKTPVLLVSVEQTKSKKEKVELSALKGELTVLKNITGKKYSKGDIMNSEDTEAFYVLEDAIDELKFVDRAYYILVHEQLVQKIHSLAASDHTVARGLLLMFDDNIITTEADDISNVKKALQTCVDSKWRSGYKASVEVKALL